MFLLGTLELNGILHEFKSFLFLYFKNIFKKFKFYFFYYFKLIFFVFLDHFDALMSKIIKKNTILIYFRVKSILKSNRNHNLKHPLRNGDDEEWLGLSWPIIFWLGN